MTDPVTHTKQQSQAGANPAHRTETTASNPEHEWPFDFEAGERGDDWYMDIGESLTFQPADPDVFDQAVKALLGATKSATVESG